MSSSGDTAHQQNFLAPPSMHYPSPLPPVIPAYVVQIALFIENWYNNPPVLSDSQTMLRRDTKSLYIFVDEGWDSQEAQRVWQVPANMYGGFRAFIGKILGDMSVEGAREDITESFGAFGSRIFEDINGLEIQAYNVAVDLAFEDLAVVWQSGDETVVVVIEQTDEALRNALDFVDRGASVEAYLELRLRTVDNP